MIGSTKQHRKNTRGFTIVEFMVATMVFGVVLLATTVAIMHISKIYKRSTITSNTQAAARNLVDTVAQAVQFSANDVTVGAGVGNTKGICVGTKQVLYTLRQQINDNIGETSTKNAVMVRGNGNNTACEVQDLETATIDNDPMELLGRGMRLAKFAVSEESNGLFTVTAQVIYGDDDLLCAENITSGSGSCVAGAAEISTTQILDTVNQLKCKSGPGSEYCATSELTVVVQRRL